MEKNEVLAVSLQDGLNTKHRLKNLDYEIALYDTRKALSPVLRVRFYWTQSGGSNTCCLWLNFSNYPDLGYEFSNGYATGSGRAMGYGYDRYSAAMEDALISAGIYLKNRIHGTGEYGINSAIEAIADKLEIPLQNRLIHRANA